MTSEHASEGAEHLQRAARELIGAARSFLDAAEELVEDRELVGDISDVVRRMAEDLGSSVRGGAGAPVWESEPGPEHADPGSPQGGGSGDGAEAGEPEGGAPDTASTRTRRVRRIDVE